MVGGGGRAREGRVEGSLNSDSDRSLCSMRDCVRTCVCVCVCARESASVLSRPSLPLHRAFARAHTLAPPQPCAAVVNESCQRERERIGESAEREREGSIRPGQSVTMSLV